LPDSLLKTSSFVETPVFVSSGYPIGPHALVTSGDLGAAGPIAEVVSRVLTATTRALERSTLDAPPHPWATVSHEDERSPNVEIEPEPVSDGITGIITPRNGSASLYVLSTPVTVLTT